MIQFLIDCYFLRPYLELKRHFRPKIDRYLICQFYVVRLLSGFDDNLLSKTVGTHPMYFSSVVIL